jgi:hypothetical protein
MRVELLAIYSTLRRAHQPGETLDLPDREAIRLIERGIARPVRTEQPELAVLPRPERAVRRRKPVHCPSPAGGAA